MKVNIEDFTSAVNQISDLATAKMMPGVLLDIKDRSIKVCYTDSNTITLLTEIPAIVTDITLRTPLPVRKTAKKNTWTGLRNVQTSSLRSCTSARTLTKPNYMPISATTLCVA